MNLQYLIKYKSFISVEDMDQAVEQHIAYHYDQLTPAECEVLRCLASHSLTAYGASHLLVETIAREIGVTVKTIYRATKKLTDLGIITKHKTVKRTGQGASIYVIAPFKKESVVRHSMSNSCQSLETHVNAVIPTDSHVKKEPVTKVFSTYSFNPSVNKNVNAYDSHAIHSDLKEQLRAVYNPQSVEANQAFEELCKIAFGRLKQYMHSHQIPYLQMTQIIIKCMSDLVRKKDVRNQFAMYSKMIERQTLQLFEKFVQPKAAAGINMYGKKVGVLPDWFVPVGERGENEIVHKESAGPSIDFEAERRRILEKLGG